MAYESTSPRSTRSSGTAAKNRSTSVQSTVDKAIKKSTGQAAAKGAVRSTRAKSNSRDDAMAQAYAQGVMDALFAQQMQQQGPLPGVQGGPGGAEMPFTQQGPPPMEDMPAPPGPPMAGPGAGAPMMVPPPGGPPPGMPGMPPMPGGGPLPPGLAPSQPIAPGPLGALGPNSLLRSRMPRM